MTEKARKFFSKMPHFSFLPDEELQRIAQTATYERYRAGALLAVQGQSQIDSIYCLNRGSLALFDEKQGEKKLAGHILSGEVFGGITILLNGGISLRTVEVERDCTGYTVSKDIFLDLCTRYKVFFEYFLENFSKNIIDPSLSTLIETGQARAFMAHVEPFSFLPQEELDQMAAQLSIVQYPADTVLFAQGRSRVGYLYILQKGSAERYFEESNRKTMHEMLGEGDTYGGISMLLNDGISVRTLKVVEQSYFYLLPIEPFLDLCDRYESFSEYYTDTFGKRMMEKSYAAIIAKTMAPQEEGLQFFNQHVATVYSGRPIFGTTDMTIRKAAEAMVGEKISSLFINSPEDDCVGVVTERDLARRVTATGYDISRPVAEIMSSPVRAVPEYALIFEALMTMLENNIRHLAVTDVNEKVVGILSNRDLLAVQGRSPLFLLRKIATANTMKEIIESHNRLPGVVRTLMTGGAKANNITRFITKVSDAILQRIMVFTLDKMGPPPAKFVFMILGSEGRSEQTLKTDQDNAIIFEDVPEARQAEVQAYFLQFGSTACALLDRAGYAFCTGDVMAQNPLWCQSLSTWKNYFSSWIHAAQPEDLLQASIFFDFKGGYGEMGYIDDLRQYLFGSLGSWAGFFRHLTENALHFKPPLGFFRNFVVESKGEHRDKFDIKSAMTPIVDFARIYALANQVEETNTLQRLSHLRIKEVLSPEEYEDLERSYSFLMQVRFARQISAVIDEKSKPDNYINPKELSRIEQKMLKEIFIRIEKFQGKLESDFIGII
jgi:CBS domain-containing protein